MEPSTLTSDFFEHPAGPRLAVPRRSYVRGKRREGEGCSWEQDTYMSLQGQHADTRHGQSCGVTSSAQDTCISSQITMDTPGTMCRGKLHAVFLPKTTICAAATPWAENRGVHKVQVQGDSPHWVKIFHAVSSDSSDARAQRSLPMFGLQRVLREAGSVVTLEL